MQTYIFAYYVEEQNQKTIFETNQNDLESATETLSQYLEEHITKDNVEEITHKVMDKSKWVQCSSLNECSFSNLTSISNILFP